MQNNILSKRRLFFPPEKLTISYIKSIIKKFYNIVKRLDLIWFFFKLNVNSWFAQKNKMFFTLCVIKLLAFYFNFKIALFVLFSIALFAAKEPFLLNFTFFLSYVITIIFYLNLSGFEAESILCTIILVYCLRDLMYFIYYCLFWVCNYIIYSLYVLLLKKKLFLTRLPLLLDTC